MAAEIYDKAVEFRDALLKRERQAASILVRSYGQSWNKIQKLLARVTAQIDDAQRRELPISPAWLFQQERYQQLILQIEREITKFAHVLDAQVKKEQSAAIRAAARNTAELAAAAQTPGTVTAGFTKLSPAAIESITAFVQEGTPLGRLLAELPRGAGKAVADALTEAVSLGYNPVKTARIIRREMGMTLTRALTIARTETLRAYREATHRSYQANDDIVQGWIWVASMSRRTCFVKGTAILTARGEVPIEAVKVGDLVLTHTGQWKCVRETMAQNYQGEMRTIATATGSITATADHPFYAELPWGKEWMEASELITQDHLIRLRQDVRQQLRHGMADSAIKGRGGNAGNAIATSGQDGGFALISVPRLIVPIRFVDFEHQVKRGQVEIDWIAPSTNSMLLFKGDTHLFQDQSDVLFRLGFASESAIAASRAELAIAGNSRRDDTELLFTGGAFNNDGRAAALLGTVPCLIAVLRESSTASLTRSAQGSAMLFPALLRAVQSPRALISLQGLAAKQASISDLCIFGSAFARAIAVRSSALVAPKLSAADFADVGSARLGDLTAPGMRMLCLMRGIAFLAAELPIASLGMASRHLETSAAFAAHTDDASIMPSSHSDLPTLRATVSGGLLAVADMHQGATAAFAALPHQINAFSFHIEPFHSESITKITIHNKPFIKVYNLEVEGDESYIANGFVVHNCVSCLALHGQWFPMTERQSSHPRCRCTSIPALKGDPNPITESGETWLKRQPEDIQRTVIGTKAGFERFKNGELTLQDFVGLQRSPQWGDSYVQLSVKRALNGEARFPQFTAPTMPAAPTPAPFSPLVKPVLTGAQIRAKMAEIDAEIASDVQRNRKLLNALKKRKPKTMPEWVELDAQMQALNNEVSRLLRSARPRYNELLWMDDEAQFAFAFKRSESVLEGTVPDLVDDPLLAALPRQRITDAINDFRRLVGDQPSLRGKTLHVRYKSQDALFVERSYYAEGSSGGVDAIWMAHDNQHIVVHELGHWLEGQDTDIFNAITEFFKRRTAGDRIERMKDLLPKSKYEPYEVTLKDKFDDAYTGSWRGQESDGKPLWDTRRSSEILSMGVQYLHEDPSGFAKSDPDFFDFIVDLLRKTKGRR